MKFYNELKNSFGGQYSLPGYNFEPISSQIFLYETWLGIPPTDGYNTDIQAVGKPAFYSQLMREGLKSNGPVLVAQYGVDRYCQLIKQNIIDYITFNVKANGIKNVNSYTGTFILDIEEVLPYFWETDKAASNKYWLTYIAQKYNIAETSPDIIHLAKVEYHQVIDPLFTFIIKQIKTICPNSKIKLYGYPGRYTGDTFLNPKDNVALKYTALVDCHYLYSLVDGFNLSLYQYYKLIAPPVSGIWTGPWTDGTDYSTNFITQQTAYLNQVKEIIKYYKKPVSITMMPVYDNSAGQFKHTAISSSDWQINVNLFKIISPDSITFWYTSNTQDQMNQVNQSLANLRPLLTQL